MPWTSTSQKQVQPQPEAGVASRHLDTSHDRYHESKAKPTCSLNTQKRNRPRSIRLAEAAVPMQLPSTPTPAAEAAEAEAHRRQPEDSRNTGPTPACSLAV